MGCARIFEDKRRLCMWDLVVLLPLATTQHEPFFDYIWGVSNPPEAAVDTRSMFASPVLFSTTGGWLVGPRSRQMTGWGFVRARVPATHIHRHHPTPSVTSPLMYRTPSVRRVQQRPASPRRLSRPTAVGPSLEDGGVEPAGAVR